MSRPVSAHVQPNAAAVALASAGGGAGPPLNPKDLEKLLWTDCPHCTPLLPLLDYLQEQLERPVRNGYVELQASSASGAIPCSVRWDSLRAICHCCKGIRRVLTDLGQQLAACLPQGVAPPAEPEVPF